VEFASKAEPPQRPNVLRRAFAVVPPPLAALLVVVVIFGVTWALIVPPWQSPDSTSHFAYAQSLAERFVLPDDVHRPSISTQQLLGIIADNTNIAEAIPATVKPDWSAADYARYQALVARTRPPASDGGGPSSATPNPPLYYLYADLGYWADVGGGVFDRLYAMQIWGVSLLLATVVGAWLLAGEVLGRRRLPQLACATVAGFIPQVTFLSTSITPDALLISLWTLTFWLGARVIVRGARQRDAVALCAVLAAAILTKATSYAIVPAVLFALLVGWSRRPEEERKAALRRLGLALLVLAVPVLVWVELARALNRPALNAIPSGAGHPFRVRQFLSYVWQFYLPRLPFLTPSIAEPGGYYELWIREAWGTFGWLDVPMANWVYHVIAWACAVILVPAVVLLARLRDRLRLSLAAFFALALGGLLALLHVLDYKQIIATGFPLLQGRYLLPVVALFGLAVGFLVGRLPRRMRAPACGALLAALLVLQVLALGTVARMFYT
jgi:4-amino-4-deoxy-L-arabinose transferase-like glycosyltransferase